MKRPKDNLQFAVGCMWVLVAALQFISGNRGSENLFGHYSWALWLFGSLIFFVNAYRTRVPPPK